MNAIITTGFFPLFAILAFLAVVLLLEGLYMIWNSYKGPEAKKIEQRLRALAAGSDSSERAAVLKRRMLSEVPAMERLLLGLPRLQALDRLLLQSGMQCTVSRLLLISLLCGALAWLILSLAGLPPLLLAVATPTSALLPFAYANWKRSRRLSRMGRQLPDALDFIGRALRAGHALSSSLQMVGEEMADPIGREFHITHDEISFGVSMPQALVNLSNRVAVNDMRYFVVAVLIQREAGGNLTELLGSLSALIRNRLKFHGRIKVLTTEGRMSAWILGLLPFALAALFSVANHDFIKVLWTDPIGIRITQIVLGIMAVGAFWLYRLIRIRV